MCSHPDEMVPDTRVSVGGEWRRRKICIRCLGKGENPFRSRLGDARGGGVGSGVTNLPRLCVPKT